MLKELYDLKQAPRLWNDGVYATLHRLNFTRCNSDPCLYVRKEKTEFVIIALYVDDLFLTSTHQIFFPKSKLLSKKITKGMILLNSLGALGESFEVLTIPVRLESVGLQKLRMITKSPQELQALKDEIGDRLQTSQDYEFEQFE